MKVYGYTRNSIGSEASTAYQKAELQKRFGAEYKDIIWIEEMGSAITNERPKWHKMVKDMLKNPKDIIILAWDVTRLIRNDETYDLPHMNQFLSKGGVIKTMTEYFDQNNTMFFGLRVIMSADEPKTKKKRVRGRWKNMLEKGEWCFGVPLGYARKDGEIITNEYKDLAIEIFEGYLKHQGGVKSYLSSVNKMCKPYRKRYTKNAIFNMLKNRFYIGQVTYENEDYTIKMPEIISQRLFNAVQKKLLGNTRKPTQSHFFAYSHGLSKCKCGRSLIAYKKKNKYIYYFCDNKECEIKSFTEKKIETVINQYFKDHKLSKKGVEKYRQAFKLERKNMHEKRKKKKKVLQQRLTMLEHKLDNMIDMRAEGDMSKEVFRHKSDQVKAEISQMEQDLQQINQDMVEFYDKLDQMLELLHDRIGTWETFNQRQKNIFGAMFGWNFLVIDKNTVEMRTYDHLENLFTEKCKNGRGDWYDAGTLQEWKNAVDRAWDYFNRSSPLDFK